MMKKRWMASVIATSKQPMPAMPFARTTRRKAKAAGRHAVTPRVGTA